jgi:hypothetical protein
MKGNYMNKIRILNIMSCGAIGIGAGAYLGGNETILILCVLYATLMNTFASILLPHERYAFREEIDTYNDHDFYYKHAYEDLKHRSKSQEIQIRGIRDMVESVEDRLPKKTTKVKTAKKI